MPKKTVCGGGVCGASNAGTVVQLRALRARSMWRTTSMLMAIVCTLAALLTAAAVPQEPGTDRQQVVAVWQPSAATVSKMQQMGFKVLEWIDGSYLMLFPRSTTAESAADLLQSTIPELRDRRTTPIDPCAVRAHHYVHKQAR